MASKMATIISASFFGAGLNEKIPEKVENFRITGRLFCNLPVLWMRAWMNDAVHVQIKIVEFYSVRIRQSSIHRHCDAINFFRLKDNAKPVKFFLLVSFRFEQNLRTYLVFIAIRYDRRVFSA